MNDLKYSNIIDRFKKLGISQQIFVQKYGKYYGIYQSTVSWILNKKISQTSIILKFMYDALNDAEHDMIDILMLEDKIKNVTLNEFYNYKIGTKRTALEMDLT